MDSLSPHVSTTPTWSARLPGWALARGRDFTESDAAFAAGIALKSLDDLIRAIRYGSAADAIASLLNRPPLAPE